MSVDAGVFNFSNLISYFFTVLLFFCCFNKVHFEPLLVVCVCFAF